MMSTEIKPFTAQAITPCAALLMKVYRAEPWEDQWPSLELAARYLQELADNPVFHGFIAYNEHQVIGVCLGHQRTWWSGNEFYIDEFYIANERQRSGIGTQLMDHVKHWAAEHDFVWLTCMTVKQYPSERFYIKRGLAQSEEYIYMYQKLEK